MKITKVWKRLKKAKSLFCLLLVTFLLVGGLPISALGETGDIVSESKDVSDYITWSDGKLEVDTGDGWTEIEADNLSEFPNGDYKFTVDWEANKEQSYYAGDYFHFNVPKEFADAEVEMEAKGKDVLGEIQIDAAGNGTATFTDEVGEFIEGSGVISFEGTYLASEKNVQTNWEFTFSNDTKYTYMGKNEAATNLKNESEVEEEESDTKTNSEVELEVDEEESITGTNSEANLTANVSDHITWSDGKLEVSTDGEWIEVEADSTSEFPYGNYKFTIFWEADKEQTYHVGDYFTFTVPVEFADLSMEMMSEDEVVLGEIQIDVEGNGTAIFTDKDAELSGISGMISVEGMYSESEEDVQVKWEFVFSNEAKYTYSKADSTVDEEDNEIDPNVEIDLIVDSIKSDFSDYITWSAGKLETYKADSTEEADWYEVPIEGHVFPYLSKNRFTISWEIDDGQSYEKGDYFTFTVPAEFGNYEDEYYANDDETLLGKIAIDESGNGNFLLTAGIEGMSDISGEIEFIGQNVEKGKDEPIEWTFIFGEDTYVYTGRSEGERLNISAFANPLRPADAENFYNDVPAAKNSPLGAAQFFHIFANSVILTSPTNGNIAAGSFSGDSKIGESNKFNYHYLKEINKIGASVFPNPEKKVVIGSGVVVSDTGESNRPWKITIGTQTTIIDSLNEYQLFQDQGENKYIDFDKEFINLKKTNIGLGEYIPDLDIPSTLDIPSDYGNLKDENNRHINISKINKPIVVIKVPSSVLTRDRRLEIRGIAEGQSVIINVDLSGVSSFDVKSPITLKNISGVELNKNNLTYCPVLWNFYSGSDAYTGRVNLGAAWKGAVLAPMSSLTAGHDKQGNFIVDKYDSTGTTDAWNWNGVLPTIEEPAPKTEFIFTKVVAPGYQEILPGAAFQLYKDETGTELYYKKDGDGNITWVTEGDATTVTAGADGKVSFEGLESGSYILKETSAPEGYQLPTGQWKIMIDEEGKIALGVVEGDTPPAIKEDQTKGYLLGNAKNYTLPQSGSGGIYGIVVLGCLSLTIGLIRFRFMYRNK